LELYRKLYLIRRAEEKIREHYNEDEMKTPMHMSMGEEAIAVGVCHALQPDDQVFGTYRSHAIFLAKTLKIEDFFAELYGKDTALLKGKGGSMHMFAPEAGFMGTSAIVASSIPIAIGAAFALKKKSGNNISVAFFGDGAIDEGNFWESLNIACLMKLPVLFVCEDNGFAIHTPTSQRHGYKSITEIVSRFDCSVFSGDSTDAEVIYNLTRRAIRQIKRKQMPCFMHLKYYRYLEHVGINEDYDAGYRSKEEYETWLKRDPVNLQREKLLKQGFSEEDITTLEKEIYQTIENSVKLAKTAPFAEAGEIHKGVSA
jgi:TPP-dependent pyruvate/acetoin dehydrogenase alpha subunit